MAFGPIDLTLMNSLVVVSSSLQAGPFLATNDSFADDRHCEQYVMIATTHHLSLHQVKLVIDHDDHLCG